MSEKISRIKKKLPKDLTKAEKNYRHKEKESISPLKRKNFTNQPN